MAGLHLPIYKQPVYGNCKKKKFYSLQETTERHENFVTTHTEAPN